MRTPEEIERARDALCWHLARGHLSNDDRCFMVGMLSALRWVKGEDDTGLTGLLEKYDSRPKE